MLQKCWDSVRPPPLGWDKILSFQEEKNKDIGGSQRDNDSSARVSTNGTSVTPGYGVVAKMVHSIYEDTW